MNFIKANSLSLVALLIMMLSSALLWNTLPDTVPSRFDWHGQVIETSSKTTAAVLLPLIYLLIMAAVNILIRLSPAKFSMPNSRRAMYVILFGVGVMMCFLHLGLLLNNGDHSFFQRLFAFGMASFLVITGNVFGKTERNFFIGIRLPWTIASTSNWKATHRLAGVLMVVSGITLALINLAYTHVLLTVTFCLVAVLTPVIYSPIYYWQHEKGRESDD